MKKLVYSKPYFIFKCDFESRNLARDAGFLWDQSSKIWKTHNPYIALKLQHYADDTAHAIFNNNTLRIKESRALSSTLEIPANLNTAYLSFQKAGVSFLKDKRIGLLADDMGVGKTIQMIGLINLLQQQKKDIKIAIICPTSLSDNWKAELKKWLTYTAFIQRIAEGSANMHPLVDIFILPYSFCSDKITFSRIKHQLDLLELRFDIMIFDEVHYLKTRTAKRTKHLWGDIRTKKGGLCELADRLYFLSGTVIENKPVEVFTLLSRFCPEVIGHMRYDDFAYRYNGAYEDEHGKMELGSGTNLDELNYLLRSSIMIRRTKEQVLPELPGRLDTLHYVDKNKIIRDLLEQENALDIDINSLGVKEMGEVSTVRRELGLAKVKQSVAFIKDLLANVDKILIFAHHREVIKLLTEQLRNYKSIVLTGSTPSKKRQQLVDIFQSDPSVRLFIGNIKAAGVGLNLTAASVVVMCERSWVPGVNEQAIDRANRKGQKNMVNVYHILVKGSLDDRIVSSNIRKDKDIKKVMR